MLDMLLLICCTLNNFLETSLHQQWELLEIILRSRELKSREKVKILLTRHFDKQLRLVAMYLYISNLLITNKNKEIYIAFRHVFCLLCMLGVVFQLSTLSDTAPRVRFGLVFVGLFYNSSFCFVLVVMECVVAVASQHHPHHVQLCSAYQ